MILYNRTPKILSHDSATKFFLILTFGLAFSLTSCDESSVVGLDVQPTNDLLNVGYIDTTTLITKTVIEDSLRTDETLLSSGIGIIGKYIDPVFGEATASLYTQMNLSSNISSTSFGKNPICDSIVLSLVYNGNYYGKSDKKQQTISVYQLLEDIKTENTYYSDTTITYSSADLANGFNFVPHPSDSVSVLGVDEKPQLRIPLLKSFGQYLLGSTNDLVDNTTFQTFLKGFYITTENTSGLSSGEGNILYFNMNISRMTIYYHNAIDTLSYDFSLGSVARFQHFNHNYTSGIDADLTSQLSTSPPAQNTVNFIQAMAGVKTKIETPYLMNWIKNGAIAINKAELVVKTDVSSAYQVDTFAVPPSLIVFGINDDKTSYLIADAFEGSAYFGGVYDATAKTYRFNIARYIQQVLDGNRSNNGLYLSVPHVTAGTSANRIVIGGGSSLSPYQMKLNITYTKLH